MRSTCLISRQDQPGCWSMQQMQLEKISRSQSLRPRYWSYCSIASSHLASDHRDNQIHMSATVETGQYNATNNSDHFTQLWYGKASLARPHVGMLRPAIMSWALLGVHHWFCSDSDNEIVLLGMYNAIWRTQAHVTLWFTQWCAAYRTNMRTTNNMLAQSHITLNRCMQADAWTLGHVGGNVWCAEWWFATVFCCATATIRNTQCICNALQQA